MLKGEPSDRAGATAYISGNAHWYTSSPTQTHPTMSSNSPTKVIIVGAGIAGPVLALFLKAKGYAPVVFERTDGLTDAGLSLWYVLVLIAFVTLRPS